MWFPEKGDGGGFSAQAKKICQRCPVQKECLEFALENDERFGIWGGKTARDRRMMVHGY